MTVAEMLHRMSSREFAEWMAYTEIEPFGQGREDHRFGILASIIANIHRDEKKRATPFESKDFFPEPDLSKLLEEEEDLAYQPQKPQTDVEEKILMGFPQPPGFRGRK